MAKHDETTNDNNGKERRTVVSAAGVQRVIEVDAPEGEPFHAQSAANPNLYLNDAYIAAHGPANPVRGRRVLPEQLHPAFAAARENSDLAGAVDPETIDTNSTANSGVQNSATDPATTETDVTADSPPTDAELEKDGKAAEKQANRKGDEGTNTPAAGANAGTNR